MVMRDFNLFNIVQTIAKLKAVVSVLSKKHINDEIVKEI